MKISLVTTTISVPQVLETYRRYGPDVEIIVAGDDVPNAVECDIAAFCASIDVRYLSYAEQASLGYAVHDIIGPRSIQRRNIALLEAIKGGADIVVTVDDDNEPINSGYFTQIHLTLFAPRMTFVATWDHGSWFNPGCMSDVPTTYRGYPYLFRSMSKDRRVVSWNMEPYVSIGILNGLVLGDPDINATERLESAPWVKGYDLPGDIVAIAPRMTRSPINSQNTAYIRDLTPLMGLPPGIGRYDDVFSSYIAQRVLMDTDYHVAFGQPFVRQNRHPHNLISDLKQEMFGMEYTERFCDDLKAMDLSSASTILGKLALVYDGIARLDYMPPIVAQFGQAWCNDLEQVL